MLAAFAVLAIAFAVLAGVNIDAQRQYDAATQTLTENLETASRNDADLKATADLTAGAGRTIRQYHRKIGGAAAADQREHHL